MNSTVAISVLTVLSAIPVVGFIVLYVQMPWRKSPVGRGVMLSMTSLAGLVGMGVLRVFFGTEYPWKNGLLMGVYTYVMVALWFMFIALLWVRYKQPPKS